MHELSICRGLLEQVQAIADRHGATRVILIKVLVGPLSGVEAQLLRQAFSIARADTVAATAELDVEAAEVRVHCTVCGAESVARPNRLLCERCGHWQTTLVSGDELLLASVELELPDHPAGGHSCARPAAVR